MEVGIEMKNPFSWVFSIKGIDVSRKWLEIEIRELDQGVTFATGAGNGLVIDAGVPRTWKDFMPGDSKSSFAAAGAFVWFWSGILPPSGRTAHCC